MVEVEALLESSQMSRRHGALQYSLTAATYLTALIEPCHSLGLDITAAAQNESASVLWDQGEMAASIGVLHDMNSGLDLQKQSIRVGKSELLAKLVSFSILLSLERSESIADNARAIKSRKPDSRSRTRSSRDTFCQRSRSSTAFLTERKRVRSFTSSPRSAINSFKTRITSRTFDESNDYDDEKSWRFRIWRRCTKQHPRKVEGISRLIAIELDNGLNWMIWSISDYTRVDRPFSGSH